jgi:hypothetical protein
MNAAVNTAAFLYGGCLRAAEAVRAILPRPKGRGLPRIPINSE